MVIPMSMFDNLSVDEIADLLRSNLANPDEPRLIDRVLYPQILAIIDRMRQAETDVARLQSVLYAALAYVQATSGPAWATALADELGSVLVATKRQ